MDINLTSEQTEEFLNDEYININLGDYRIYMELTREKDIWYFEFVKSKNLILNHEQILEYYMIFGGVPYYWNFIEKGLGITQNIDRILHPLYHVNDFLLFLVLYL